MTLCIGAELTFMHRVNGRLGSNKFYKVVLAGNGVFTCYGRRLTSAAGNYGATLYATRDEAAAGFWRLVRSKTGKGYGVVDAAVFDVADDEIIRACRPQVGYAAADRTMIINWDAEQRGERFRARQAILQHPDLQGRSPRTPREGKALITALLDPHCDHDVLMQCALADPTERFLVPMGLSHPACPDDVKVAHYLTGGNLMALASR